MGERKPTKAQLTQRLLEDVEGELGELLTFARVEKIPLRPQEIVSLGNLRARVRAALSKASPSAEEK